MEQDHKYLFDILSLEMVLKKANFTDVTVKSYYLSSKGPAFDWISAILSMIPLGGMLFVRAAYKDDYRIENRKTWSKYD